MSMQAATSLLPILVALVAGWAMRRWLLPVKAIPVLIGLIGPMVWCLLFLVGVEFAGALASLDAIGYVLRIAALLVVATTAVPCLLLIGAARLQKGAGRNEATSWRKHARFDLALARAPLKECGTALAMVCAGVASSVGLSAAGVAMDGLWLPPSSIMLLSLIVLVGIDLAGFSIGKTVLSWAVICVPLAVIGGSIIGGRRPSDHRGGHPRVACSVQRFRLVHPLKHACGIAFGRASRRHCAGCRPRAGAVRHCSAVSVRSATRKSRDRCCGRHCHGLHPAHRPADMSKWCNTGCIGERLHPDDHRPLPDHCASGRMTQRFLPRWRPCSTRRYPRYRHARGTGRALCFALSTPCTPR
jgi:hypothetical protein